MSTLAPLLEAFFTERLIGQRDASPHTVASYRDAICLLLRFAQRRTGKAAAPADHRGPRRAADRRRSSTIWRPNAASASAPATPGSPPSVRCSTSPPTATPNTPRLIQRVLAIPPKRTDRALVTYLTDDEMQALLAAPDRSTWIGRRDHALLLLALETGLRVSELTGLTCGAVQPRRRRTRALPRQRPQGADHPAAPRRPERLLRSLASTSGPGRPTIRCSQAHEATASAATPSAASSSATSPPPPRTCPSLTAKNVTPTPCATAAQ